MNAALKTIVIVLSMAATASGQAGTPVAGPVRLDVRAGLASDGMYLYGVAAGNRAIIRTFINAERRWEIVPGSQGSGVAARGITGLAAVPGTLFVLSTSPNRISAIRTAAVGTSGGELRDADVPLAQPDALAAAGGQLFVADSSTGEVVRFVDGRAVEDIAKSWMERRPGAQIALSGHGESLLIGREDGALVLIDSVHTAGKTPPKFLQRELRTAAPAQKYQRALEPAAGVRLRPLSASVFNGLVYGVDGTDMRAFVLDPSTGRPLALEATLAPAVRSRRVLAIDRALFVLTAEGLLRESPRPVPAEIIMSRRAIAPLIPRLYAHLRSHRLLATRRIPIDVNVEETLRRSRFLGGGVRTDELRAVVCDLNARLCAGDELTRVTAGDLVLPDWVASTSIDQERVVLTGTSSLAQEIDRRVVSAEFASWKSEEKIAALNRGRLPVKTPFNLIRKGVFYVPAEQMRYVVPLERRDLEPGSEWLAMVKDIDGVRIRSLERIRAAAAGAMQTLSDEDRRLMGEAWARVQATIKATDLKITRSENSPDPKVGVADGYIHSAHTAFGDAFRDSPPAPAPAVPAATAAAGAAAPAEEGEAGAWRQIDREIDHGTAVASLIGATNFGFGAAGLLAGVPLVALPKDEPAVSTQVKSAFLELDVPIFNLSFSFDANVTPGLGQVIDDLPQALFVVAAGNDWTTAESEGKLCQGQLNIYPQCWWNKKNVIVVTGTNLDGTHLLPPVTTGGVTFPGSNWSPQAVHLAAPAENFFAAGNPDGYVRVRGSSFAAPLVSAVAAALYSAGVDDPLLIKQRLVSTADRVVTLTSYVQAGVLNAERALKSLTKGVVHDGTRELVIAPLRSSDLMTIPSASGDASIQVPLRNIRRITKVGSRIRVIYAHFSEWSAERTRVEVPDALAVVEIPHQNWPIQYREVDPKTFAPGDAVKTINLGTVTDYVGPIIR
jgi:hypothetical protein